MVNEENKKENNDEQNLDSIVNLDNIQDSGNNPFALSGSEKSQGEVENTEEVKEDDKAKKNLKKDKKKGINLFGKGEAEKLKTELQDMNNKYLRLAADFENYRKRQAQERESLIRFGMEEALKKMIEVADNFDRGQKSIENVTECDKVKEAFSVLNKQFNDSLAKLGLEVIPAKGEVFNPNMHEAVMQKQTDEYPEDTIVDELQKGYKYKDKVLRPSMVSVAVK